MGMQSTGLLEGIMAHFYGTLKGNRGEASRLGTKASGIRTTAASWEGAVQVLLTHEDGVDTAYVSLIPWNGKGTNKVLYSGPVSGKANETPHKTR